MPSARATKLAEGFSAKLLRHIYENAPIDSIVNRLRRGLDDLVTNIADPNYQALKLQYGALSELEKDVARRSVTAGRQSIKGLVDFTDIFSGGQVINGILSANPAGVAQGLVQKGIAQTIKYINNPDRIVAKMFKDADKALTDLVHLGQSVTPKPTPRYQPRLPAPAPRAPKAEVRTAIPLPAKAQSTIDAQERANLRRVGGKFSRRYAPR
jgi:hypothetical protein